ncbi:MAG: OmpA family protein [Desulfobacteraceae bacterium]|jgi:hypothetical protein
MLKQFGILIIGALLLALLAAPAFGAAPGPSVVVHFDNGKAYLNDADKDKLHRLFKAYDVRKSGRVFVLGYTDSRGNRQYNYSLSRKRAQSVRREIIDSFGIGATIVMALGKGPENPIADNAKADGRARNRRAEVYLANVDPRKPKRSYGPNDPHLSKINDHIKAADDLIRRRQFNDALHRLKQAHALGGDHYADWHTAMGIAGFYADVPADSVKAHLATALGLDPYHYKAREFLSRVEARQLVAAGQITRKMGRSVKDAIAVTTSAQEYEFLHLFGMQPLSHRKLDHRPVVAWECENPKGNRVTYYFDHTQTFSWAFAQASGRAPQLNMKRAPALDIKAAAADKGAPQLPSVSANEENQPPESDLSQNPQRIWQSTLFK